ncbi:DUF5939 domain-containing protein [Paenibacillus paridis]|uniref:DUF5939 domain-containing protein n=1 Tax=Paenibacillus paridis TaxID=2583376 RepID=UPI00112207CC|nr:hypothetical protein [Paenibacillus paridis]
MYYPSLNFLKDYRIDPIIIDKIDRWLSIQLRSTYHFINPQQFAIDMKVDIELSVDTFALCCHNPISLMNVKYRVICPNCGQTDRHITEFDFESEYYVECSNCTYSYDVSENQEFIELFFVLLFEPEIKPTSQILLPEEVKKILGKSESLRFTDVKKGSTRRLLLNSYKNFASD